MTTLKLQIKARSTKSNITKSSNSAYLPKVAVDKARWGKNVIHTD